MSSGEMSGFSAAALISMATTSSSASAASCAGPWIWGRQRKPYGSWIRPSGGVGRSSAPINSRMRRATSADPRCGRAACRGGVRLVRAVHGEQGERGDDLGGLQESAQFVQGERGLAEGEGVAADEREGVVVVELLRFGGSVPPPGMLPHQRESELRERRQVPGPDRAELVDDRVGPALQGLAQRRDDAGPQPRAAGEQLVGADGEHGPDLPGGQFLADGAGVAAQQAQPVFGGRLGGHVLVPVGADAGGAAVDAAGGGDLAGGVPGLGHPLRRVGAGDRPCGPVGEARDVGDAEGDPVEDDETRAASGKASMIRDRIRSQTPLDPDIRSRLSVIRCLGSAPSR